MTAYKPDNFLSRPSCTETVLAFDLTLEFLRAGIRFSLHLLTAHLRRN
jgi:hypothetical protein